MAALAVLSAGMGQAAQLQDWAHSRWKADWISCPDAPQRDAGVFHFRKMVKLAEQPKTFLVHVSGENIIGATIWNFGTSNPAAQMSSQTGFVLKGDGESEQGGLQNVKASMPHPKGRIDVSFRIRQWHGRADRLSGGRAG